MSAGTPRVGFVGLGSQGAPIARRIIGAGYPTTLYARRPEALEPFASSAADVAGSLADLGAAVELAGVCVLDDDGVLAVSKRLLETMRPGSVLAVHSTVHPRTVQQVAERAGQRSVTVIDAPVSGGPDAADEGTLLVMAGGDAGVLDRVRPVFETFGSPILHLGPIGAGQRAKLINNLLLAANIGVAGSAFALGAQLDVDPAQLAVVLAHGSGNSRGARMIGPPDYSLATVSDKAKVILDKDARILADLATAAGVNPGMVLDAANTALESMGRRR
jgi:3-hydroxyisobutyrate dehydrogenase-like beta-hydroxyacid dehydrogenase